MYLYSYFSLDIIVFFYVLKHIFYVIYVYVFMYLYMCLLYLQLFYYIFLYIYTTGNIIEYNRIYIYGRWFLKMEDPQ